MADLEVPVLIAGGSLVGMSTAMLLAHQGVRPMVVEHHRGTAIHPRAAMINQRTMEILRQVGVEQVVRSRSEQQFVQDGGIVAVESLEGKELAAHIPNLNDGVRDVSPSVRLFITQSLLEPLLKSRAEEMGADLRFATEMISFQQDSKGVTAQIRNRDSGQVDTVRAHYLVGADGSHSRVRHQLGIRLTGRGVLSHSVTIYFRAHVGPLLRGRSLSVILVRNPVLRGFFRIEKPFESGFLVVNTVGDPMHPTTDVSTGLTNERSLEYLYAAFGTSDVPATIENVMHWKATADVAERVQEGRVFLAGDAAHVMPPYGGFGGNCGIHDAHNLAWKLAMVVKGHAGEGLLSTYELERMPAGKLTTEQAYTRYVTREATYLGTDGMQPQENDLNIELGHRYHSSAVIPAPDENGRSHENPREAKGKPGSRAPHIWLSPDVSTLDLFGSKFVLLTGGGGVSWVHAASTLPIDVHRLEQAEFPEAYGIANTGAVLVRPDGFVAWRAKTAEGSSVELLQGVLGRLLGRL
jgi:2-polyprenyl-6-methoxyphenol hydroxylase-like FAD-dependent oxidoreductase